MRISKERLAKSCFLLSLLVWMALVCCNGNAQELSQQEITEEAAIQNRIVSNPILLEDDSAYRKEVVSDWAMHKFAENQTN